MIIEKTNIEFTSLQVKPDDVLSPPEVADPFLGYFLKHFKQRLMIN